MPTLEGGQEPETTMSTTLPANKKLPIGIAAAAIAAIAAFAALGYFVAARVDSAVEAPVGPAPAPSPQVSHAPWRVTVKSVGGPVEKTQRRALRGRRQEVTDHVRGIYDGLFERRSGIYEVAQTYFSARAAVRFARSLRDVPGIDTIKILSRRATVAIGADDLRHATASLVLKLRADAGARKVRFVHRATLWLERAASGWSVIAFSLDEAPLR